MCRKMNYSSAELMEQLREVIAMQAKSPENALHVMYRDSLPSSLVSDFLERIEEAHRRELTKVGKHGFAYGYARCHSDHERIINQELDERYLADQTEFYDPHIDEVIRGR